MLSVNLLLTFGLMVVHEPGSQLVSLKHDSTANTIRLHWYRHWPYHLSYQ